ncbi:hypothetical protein QR680_015314 [Steinernema hermaphroditum]|uniref:Uncharacterized protein n=1 Tax=Steinernema hermaphroditum TaxID=289476 RepID=A0AA39H966_9BILA|nr:hypothetical protein QR680_015314 [Steinernema hermaphroditum]
MSDRSPSTSSAGTLRAAAPGGQIPAFFPPPSYAYNPYMPSPFGYMPPPAWPFHAPHFPAPYGPFPVAVPPTDYMNTPNPPFYVNATGSSTQVVGSLSGQIPAFFPPVPTLPQLSSSQVASCYGDSYDQSSPATPGSKNKRGHKRRKKSPADGTPKEKKGRKKKEESVDRKSSTGSSRQSNTSSSNVTGDVSNSATPKKRQFVKHEMFISKGTFVFRLADYGTSRDNAIWCVDNYRLITKYEHVYSKPEKGTAVFSPTNRFAGWVSTEPESYHVFSDVVRLENGLVEVQVPPERELKERHLLMLEHLANLSANEENDEMSGIKVEPLDYSYEMRAFEEIPSERAIVKTEGEEPGTGSFDEESADNRSPVQEKLKDPY